MFVDHHLASRRRHTRRRGWLALASVAAIAVAAASCGGDDDSNGGDSGDDTGEGAETEQTGILGGDSGSGTAVGTVEEGTPVDGGDLTVIHVSNPSSLDPISGGSGNDHVSLYPFYDRLINFEPATLVAKPGLAKSWKYPNPTTLELKLREGVTFHDGAPFDADAVKFNLDRAMTLKTSTVVADLEMIESVEAVDPTTVRIHLNRPDSSLLLTLADRPGMMVSPKAAESGENIGRNPVGTGPFRFVEWLPNDRLVGEKNPDYWQNGLPHLDRLTIRYIADQQTGINALTAGEADMAMKISPVDVETLEGNADLDVVTTPSLSLETCYFNFSKPPFDSKDARLAVEHAINREELNEAYTFGLAQPAHEVYPPDYWAYAEDLGDRFEYDPDLAKQLLADAGYEDGVSIKAIAYDASGQTRKNEIIQAQLADVGIDMKFDVMEVGAATSTFFEDLDYDLYCAGWSGRPDPSQTALSLFDKGAFYNAGHYDSPGMEEALVAAGKSVDTEERAKAFHKVIELSQEDALFVPLLHQPDINAMYSRVGGFQPNLYGKIDLSFMWIDE